MCVFQLKKFNLNMNEMKKKRNEMRDDGDKKNKNNKIMTTMTNDKKATSLKLISNKTIYYY